jgi:hypothetical protein
MPEIIHIGQAGGGRAMNGNGMSSIISSRVWVNRKSHSSFALGLLSSGPRNSSNRLRPHGVFRQADL